MRNTAFLALQVNETGSNSTADKNMFEYSQTS